jgi:hypothetical protein
MLTTDPKDPRLTRYTGPEKPAPQAEVYLVLSDEERARGFVRPVRSTYRHIGSRGPAHPLRDLTAEELARYASYGYVKFEAYRGEGSVTGRFWTQAQLDQIGRGCGTTTAMGQAIAETYARNPSFYGATYCCTCQAHFPVGPAGEFVWEDGSRVGE